MTKLKDPLLSFGARGRLGQAVTLIFRRKQSVASVVPLPHDAKTNAQLSWRHMYQKAVALWHALSPEEKQEWESLARRKHMTGYAWFLSQCLKPNPGIYLPLQGGTMQGDIEMAGHRILALPTPTADQEAATKKYVDDSIIPNYTAGARVYHDAHQVINTGISSDLVFNTARWDTDNMLVGITDPGSLRCNTPGVYVISSTLRIQQNATGYRVVSIILNGTTYIATVHQSGSAAFSNAITISTLYKLAVGNYLDIRVFQDSGAWLNVWMIANESAEFMAQRIG